eukprot:748309-Hanusia_phi.AAC.5
MVAVCSLARECTAFLIENENMRLFLEEMTTISDKDREGEEKKALVLIVFLVDLAVFVGSRKAASSCKQAECFGANAVASFPRILDMLDSENEDIVRGVISLTVNIFHCLFVWKEKLEASVSTSQLKNALLGHRNGTFFGETLLQILNSHEADQDETTRMLVAVHCLLRSESNDVSQRSIIFFDSDLPILVTVSLRLLSNDADEMNQTLLMKILSELMSIEIINNNQ